MICSTLSCATERSTWVTIREASIRTGNFLWRRRNIGQVGVCIAGSPRRRANAHEHRRRNP